MTGAAGFIGAALAQRLLDSGHHVVALDNLSTGVLENVPDGALFIKGNCQDPNLYKQIPSCNFDAIFHIAGQSSGEISFDDPVYDLQTNTQSTLLLLEFARCHGCKRMLYASTMSVYGDQPNIPIPETVNPNPKSFYGVGKFASEHYLRLYRQYGIQSASLRLFNVYGPGQNMANLRQGMVSIYLAQALEMHEIQVKGSGDRYRDFVYIDDVVDAFLALGSCSLENYSEFNVATGVRTTVFELIEYLSASLPFEVRVCYEGATLGDVFGITGNADRLRHLAGWSPKTNLQAGLERMVAWAMLAKKK